MTLDPGTPDPRLGALRLALERQFAGLVPVALDVHAAATHPPIAPHDWHGPASRAYAGLESALASQLAAADRAVSAALASTRLALAGLG